MLPYLLAVLKWLLPAFSATLRLSKEVSPWMHFILVLWTAIELCLKAIGLHV